MIIALTISGSIGVILWVLCILDWYSDDTKAGIFAYFLKYPAILSSIIFIILLAIKAFTN